MNVIEGWSPAFRATRGADPIRADVIAVVDTRGAIRG